MPLRLTSTAPTSFFRGQGDKTAKSPSVSPVRFPPTGGRAGQGRAGSVMHLLAAYELCLLILVVTLLPVATPMPPVGAALRNVGRLPYIPIRSGFLLFLFISGKLLRALAVAGKEATSEVHLLAAYVVWLLMLVVTLMPVVIPRPPLVGRVALLIPPIVVRARATLRNVGRLPHIPIRFGFLLLLFISGELRRAI